jgi:hypothetical protein
MNRHRFFCVVILLVIVSLGCNLPGQLIPTAIYTPTEPPPPADEPEMPSTVTSTLEPPPQPLTATTAPPPAPSANLIPFFPNGFVTAFADGSALTFFDLNGQPQGIVQTPGGSTGPGNYFHMAGVFTGNPAEVPVIFHTFDNMGDIKQTLTGQVNTLFPGPDAAYIRGAPGQFAIVYSTVTWGDSLSSYLYLRTAYGGGASWFWERTDPNGQALFPLAVAAENNEPQMVFYTLMPWGIGGDIVFPPVSGLFQLNLEHLEEILHLTEDFVPMGLSPDNSIVAYTEENNVVSDPNTRLTLYTLQGGLGLPIDLAPGSDRGAGYAVFSPDNRYVAWMEGSGWFMAEVPNFRSRVRIADVNTGAILADLPAATLASVAADPNADWAQPVGWLDGETLLVEIRGEDWSQTSVVKVRFDGNELAYLANGMFVDFLYP